MIERDFFFWGGGQLFSIYLTLSLSLTHSLSLSSYVVCLFHLSILVSQSLRKKISSTDTFLFPYDSNAVFRDKYHTKSYPTLGVYRQQTLSYFGTTGCLLLFAINLAPFQDIFKNIQCVHIIQSILYIRKYFGIILCYYNSE